MIKNRTKGATQGGENPQLRSDGGVNQLRRSNDKGEVMKKVFATIMSMAMLVAFTPLANAQSACPPEVAKAKEMMSQKSVTAPRSLVGARQDPQAAPGSRTLEAARAE